MSKEIKELLTPHFISILDELFNQLGKGICDKELVHNITSSYYVVNDLKADFALSLIEKDRLIDFHTYCWNYVSKFPEQRRIQQLLVLCDDELSDRAQPNHISQLLT